MRRLSHLLLLVAAGCGQAAVTGPDAPTPGAPAPDADKLDVRALSVPAAWLAQRIGGDDVTVTLVPPVGEDPPFWQPTGDVVADLAAADLIVGNGAGFERWTTTASLPADKLVMSADGLDLITLPGVSHSHGKGGAHSHAGTDPHTWSDPALLTLQAVRVHSALVAARPAEQADLDARLAALKAELKALGAELAAALAPAKGRRLAASHPAYNYLARAYGLDVRSFSLDADEVPTAQTLAEISAWAATAGPEPVLLWESAPGTAVIDALPEGIRHVYVDNLEQPPESGPYDYVTQTRANVRSFHDVFSAPAATTPPPRP